MEKMKLTNICTPKQWKTIPTSQLLSNGYPVYGANGIIGYYKTYNHEQSVIAITCRGASCGTINITRPQSYITGNAMCLDNVREDINLKYLYYNLLSFDFNKVISGSAQPQITRQGLEKVEISICPPTEQISIVSILTSIESLILARKKELNYLDELVKARFVEMFGNPVINNKAWVQKSLGEITSKIGSGATPKGGKEAYKEEGITLIRSMNVHNGRFEYKDLAHISNEQAVKLDNVVVEKNDILLNITGASVARSCLVPSEILPARVNQHVCIIRCKECVIPGFLNRILVDDNYQKLLWGIAGSGATREAITKQQVENLQVIIPPLKLQNQFADFVTQVNKSKVAIQKALGEAQTLFDSLMQEYFG